MGKLRSKTLLASLKVLLAITLCVGMSPAAAFAASGGKADAQGAGALASAANGEAGNGPNAEQDASASGAAVTTETDASTGLVTVTVDNNFGFGHTQTYRSADRMSAFANQSAVDLAYSLIAQGYEQGKTTVDIAKYGIAVDDFEAAVAMALQDPEFYYGGRSINYSYRFDADGNPGSVVSFTLSYLFDASQLDTVKANFEQKVAEAMSWITDDMSDLLKMQALHDYLVRTIKYNTAAASSGGYSNAHTAYGALVEQSCVCQGYSMAYELLLTRLGIPCVYVTSKAMNHGWNMVQLDGQWYHVDCTWDDPLPDSGFDPEPSHDHFLRSDDAMRNYLAHYGWTSDYTAPVDYPAYDMPTFNGPLRPTPEPSKPSHPVETTVVEAPQGKTLTYNGAQQTGVDAGEGYTVSGNTGTNAGDYTAKASLTDKANSIWDTTGSSADILVSWSIEPCSVSGAKVSGISKTYEFDGSDVEPHPTVKVDGRTLTEGTDYELDWWNNSGPGTGKVGITGIGNYTDSIERSFTIVSTPEPEPTPDPTPDPDPEPTPDPDPDPDPAPDPEPDPDPTPNPDPSDSATLTRLAGIEATYTSTRIALEAFPEGSEWVVVARDDDFADAMSATGLAGTLGCPIVLTSRYGLTGTAEYAVKALGAKKAYVIGGRGAIPGDLERQLAFSGCQVQARVYGEESWNTSVACAEKIAEHGGNPNGDAIVAMSSNFQDALSISSFAYKYQVPIYLETSGDDRKLPAEARKAIKKLGGTVYVPGGPGAVPTSSVEGVFTGKEVVRIFGEDGYDTSNQIATYMVEHDLLSASTVCVASGAPAPKGVDALAGAALAGKAGGIMLLANDNAQFGDVDSTTIDGGDSQGAQAFLASHAGDVNQAYLLGGEAVVGTELQQKVAGLLG